MAYDERYDCSNCGGVGFMDGYRHNEETMCKLCDGTGSKIIEQKLRYIKYLEDRIENWNIAFNRFEVWKEVNDKKTEHGI